MRRPGESLTAGARPIRSMPSRPAKTPAGGGSSTWGRWLLASRLYALTLGYGSPQSFFAVAPDSWPGDITVGQRLLLGELVVRGSVGAVAPESDDPPWQRAGASTAWLEALNGFGWLRDLRDCGDLAAAPLAARLVDDWTNREWRWSPLAWRRDVLAERIVAWIRHYDWLATAADPGFAARFVLSLARQRKHLRRTLRAGLIGHEAVGALKALIFADLAFLRDGKRFERSLEQTLGRLSRFVKRYVLHDGIVAERAPHFQLAVLRHLIDVRAALASAERRAPAELVAAIDRMAPMLRFFRHGDGGLALFNGAWEGDRTLIDLALARSGSGEAAPMMALVSGFQRMAAGTSLVIADSGSPPGRGMDGIAHAGTLSFEMSAAHERLVTNCGTYPGAPRDWQHFMRYTAAHSTAVVDDTNSTEITDHGALEYRAGNVLVDRADNEGRAMARHEPRRLSLALRHHPPPQAVAVARRWRPARRGHLHGPRRQAGHGGRPALHRALPSASGGEGDLGAKRPGGADAPAERPRLAAARVRRGHRSRREHLSRRGRPRAPHRADRAGGAGAARGQHREVGADPDGRVVWSADLQVRIVIHERTWRSALP